MRSLVPTEQLAPGMADSLREAIEADLIAKASKDKPTQTNWVVRELLPWTDLNITSAGQAGSTTDYWGTGALTASTPLVYVNHKLDDDQYVAIYGVNIRDTLPSTINVVFQTGNAASTKAYWNIERLYGTRVPEGITPEYAYYGGSSIVYVQVYPDSVGKAAGSDGVADHLILLGLIAMPAGDVVSY